MTKFDYKKWVTQNKHGKLNEQGGSSPQAIVCGQGGYAGACHTWKECISGNPSGNDIVFFDMQGTSPADYWNMFGNPNQGDAILTNTGVKLIYTGLNGDLLDLEQFLFYQGQQAGFGQTPTSATSTQCDFGWRCHWKTTPQDFGQLVAPPIIESPSSLNEWAPHYMCAKGTATNPGSFTTKQQCLDSGCLRHAGDADAPADEFDINPFNPNNPSSEPRPDREYGEEDEFDF